jgi:hypothetical protein
MAFKNHNSEKVHDLAFRELGILVYAFTTGKSINGREYAKVAREGRDSVYRSLKFLTKNGYTVTTTEKINGRLVRATRLTSKSVGILMNLGVQENSARPDSQYCLLAIS